MRNMHPLEPESIRANVPPSHGPMQPGHALDFHASTAHLPKAQTGHTGNRTGQGYMARKAILTRTAKEWGVM